MYRLQNTCLLCSWLLLTACDSSFLVYCVMCNTSAVFNSAKNVGSQPNFSRIFTYRDNSAMPNVSRNFFQAIRKLKIKRRGVYCPLLVSKKVVLAIQWMTINPFQQRGLKIVRSNWVTAAVVVANIVVILILILINFRFILCGLDWFVVARLSENLFKYKRDLYACASIDFGVP